MKIITDLKFAWKLFCIYMKLSIEDRNEFIRLLETGDEVGLEFFFRRHRKLIK